MFKCDSCEKEYDNEMGLRVHKARKHKADPVIIQCLNCEKIISFSYTATNKYCSNTCQKEYEVKQRMKAVEEGKQVKGHSIKRYLIMTYGNKCMDPNCAWDFNKRPIDVELEHIDGNGDNNVLSNCILLCPNCHSQTPTYKNKNKGNGRFTRRQRYAEGKSA